jgi:hypothetical protein
MPAAFPQIGEAALGDFELVRNAGGEWLLILPRLPDALADNPLEEMAARVEEQNLILENSVAQVSVSNILAHHYLNALLADKPSSLLVSVVDEDGVRSFSQRVKLSYS